jgi:hypothetical protein
MQAQVTETLNWDTDQDFFGQVEELQWFLFGLLGMNEPARNNVDAIPGTTYSRTNWAEWDFPGGVFRVEYYYMYPVTNRAWGASSGRELKFIAFQQADNGTQL